jgi:glycerol-3-phosphate dehydrogenase
LVQEALHERAICAEKRAYVAQPLPFVMPTYQWWERRSSACGLKMYDLLAGAQVLGRTEMLGRGKPRVLADCCRTKGLSGGVKYWDGQFNDARLALALARTAATRGALTGELLPRRRFAVRRQGKVSGVMCEDTPDG